MGYIATSGSRHSNQRDWRVMDWLSIISALWPIAVGFAALIFWLAKSYADIEVLKDKVRVLYELHNARERD